jgi:uncharacterized protein
MRGWKTIVLLLVSNVFMTFAWYGHLKIRQFEWGRNMGLWVVILMSWGMAFFEYLFQVPANRIGFEENGGPFNLVQLKTLQEAITLTIFTAFTLIFFKDQKLAWNHFLGFGLIVAAVWVIFKKW